MSILDRIFYNNFITTLTAGINSSVTIVPVSSVLGLTLPFGREIRATISSGSSVEIVTITGITGTNLTVVRGEEGTSATAFSTGAALSIRVTAGTLDEIVAQLRTILSYTGPVESQWGSVSSLVQVGSIDVSVNATNKWKLQFKPDGTKMYLSDTDTIVEYSLSTAWVVSSAIYVADRTIPGGYGFPDGFAFSPDGSKLFTLGVGVWPDVAQYIRQFSMTDWDLTTLSYVGVSPDLSTTLGGITDFIVADSGSRIYLRMRENSNSFSSSAVIVALAMSVPYNALTLNITPTSTLVTNSVYANAYCIAVSADGLKVLVSTATSGSPDWLYFDVYNLSIAFNLSSATLLESAAAPFQDKAVEGLFIGNNESLLISSHEDTVYAYSW